MSQGTKRLETAETICLALSLPPTVALTGFDFYSHFFNTSARYAWGSLIGEHVGNFGFSAAWIIGSLFAQESTRIIGEKLHNAPLIRISKAIPILAIAIGANLNLFVEHTLAPNDQFLGDVGMGILALGLGLATTKLTLNRYRRKKSTHIPLTDTVSYPHYAKS